MSKEEKNKIVPRLRFPEFEDDGEWVEKMLGEVGEIITGKTPSTENEDFWGGDILFITPTDIIEDNKYQSKTQRTITKQANTRILPTGSITYTCIASIGKIAITCKNSITNQQINSIAVHSGFDNEFVYYSLINITPYIKSIPATSTLPIINKSEFSKLFINIPDQQNEQQKIADCLSSLDDLLTAENGKLEALKAHKKGLMQQLFPAEGETVPKLRFAEFRDSGEWEERALDEVGKFVGGGTPSKSNQTYWKGNIPWISSSDIDEESIHQITISRFINDEALEDSATKLIPPNSILLVSRVGVGKLAITRKAICTSQDFTNLTPDNDDVIFLAYYLKSLSKTLLAFSQGMAIKGFTKDDVSKLKLFIPTLKEQQKIAECLSSLDEFITAQAQKIEALTQHKKGLLQGLFPGAADT